MPWDQKTFRERHNRRATGKVGKTAAKMATKMVERGLPEGEAIATANKYVARKQGRTVSRRSSTTGWSTDGQGRLGWQKSR